MPLTVRLNDLDANSLGRAGGKAANLGELLRAGLPVPPGFVLTTDAYQQFVTANSLQEEIDRCIQVAAPNDPASLEEAALRLAQRFASGIIPDPITTALQEAYRGMGNPPVAVR